MSSSEQSLRTNIFTCLSFLSFVQGNETVYEDVSKRVATVVSWFLSVTDGLRLTICRVPSYRTSKGLYERFRNIFHPPRHGRLTVYGYCEFDGVYDIGMNIGTQLPDPYGTKTPVGELSDHKERTHSRDSLMYDSPRKVSVGVQNDKRRD